MESVMATIASVDDGKTYPRNSEKKWPAGLLAPRFEQFYQESECIVKAVGEAFEGPQLCSTHDRSGGIARTC